MCASIPESKLKFPDISSENMNFFLYIKSKEMFSSEMTYIYIKCIKCSETTAKHKSLGNELIGPMKRFSQFSPFCLYRSTATAICPTGWLRKRQEKEGN